MLSLCVLTGCGTMGKAIDTDRESRNFEIEYVVELSDCPVGEEIEIWVPVPRGDDHQIISANGIEVGDLLENSVSEDRLDSRGNKMVHITGKLKKPAGKMTFKATVQRFVNNVDLMDSAKTAVKNLLQIPSTFSLHRSAS